MGIPSDILNRVMDVLLRDAKHSDVERLLIWRNDHVTRQNSLNQEPVSREDHERWFRNRLISSDSDLLIAEADGVPVGVVRLDWDEDMANCDLSFTVAPEHRGKGFGLKIVRQALKELRNVRVCAEVKTSNIASLRIFSTLGFEIIDSQGEVLMYAKDF
jgi:UDP-2,4-diacetamido-2,4,6-trideoxy-beta-L-altropyranose hydrolase